MRHILKDFRISEVSAVDRPAQLGAKMVMIKRDAGNPDSPDWDPFIKREFTAEQRQAAADKGHAMPNGGYPIENKGDLHNAIQAFGRGGARPSVKAHIKARAKALGATDLLPAHWSMSKADARPMEAVADQLFAKYYPLAVDPVKGAISFNSLIDSFKQGEEFQDVMEEVNPYLDALRTSLASVLGDEALDDNARLLDLRSCVEDFLAAIRNDWPHIMSSIEKVAKGVSMSDPSPKVKIPNANTIVEDDDDNFTEALTATPKNGGSKTDKRDVAVIKAALAEIPEELRKSLQAVITAGTNAILKAKKKPAGKDDGDPEDKADGGDDEATEKRLNAEADDFIAKASKMAPDELAHMGTLPTPAEKKKFANLSGEDRKKQIDGMKKNDESLVVEGETIFKSVVGPGVFKMLKQQGERTEKLEKQAKEERDARIASDMRKRADDEFPHLPGTVDKRAAVLTAISTMPEAIQKDLESMLKAGEGAIKGAFQKIGHAGGRNVATAAAFEKRITDIQERDKITKTEAMSKARKEHPDEFAAYQAVENATN